MREKANARKVRFLFTRFVYVYVLYKVRELEYCRGFITKLECYFTIGIFTSNFHSFARNYKISTTFQELCQADDVQT